MGLLCGLNNKGVSEGTNQMKLSIIWILCDSAERNNATLQSLRGELQGDEQLILCGTAKQKETCVDDCLRSAVWIDTEANDNEYEAFRQASERVTGEFTTQLNSGDTLSAGWLRAVGEAAEKHPKESIFMMRKIMPDGKAGAFSEPQSPVDHIAVSLKERYNIVPFYFGGTVIRSSFFEKIHFRPEHGLEMEREFMLRICYKKMSLMYLPNVSYYSFETREGDPTFYKGIYNEKWYDASFTEFWIPFFRKIKESGKEIPYFLQYQAMFSVISRIKSNWNNSNKHIIPEGHEEDCLRLFGELFQCIDDPVLYNAHKVKSCIATDSTKWLFGVLKNGEDYRFCTGYLNGGVYYAGGQTLLNKLSELSTNIIFMEYKDGRLEIDATIHPVLYSMADEIYALYNEKKYELNYTGRYSMTKIYGVSVYKTHPFHVSIPVEEADGREFAGLSFCADIGRENVHTKLSFESHFSRISNRFPACYWCFGGEKKYMMTRNGNELCIRLMKNPKKEQKRQERQLQKQMLCHHSKRDLVFLAVRKAYFFMKPIMKKKPIWMYLDKIYKGGDSSEYLFRYASAQDDDIQHYYLIDKNATDYERLKKDGYKPLVRGSIKHRLIFLMADMMVISNSTVFAFNNYGLPNSSYIRDLVNFHVCCVQHGMSVQKIAVAQNRLRDNTRLYFCASEYEIKNLSKPVYDYVGYDALKLTGVPRYDGLKDDDKKQIMISPTWRMQAAVPVRTSESEQRDYNPLFKESTYFKVFNSLINDPRLIEAAKKYGYRIKYVLHPIVSSQVDDFDRNDYVDIIPAVGDMSYERMFCESSLMVTDFSGIQFDFAYMRKPLVYLHHKDIPQHYEEGTFFYDTMAFGEICHDNDELIDTLCEYMANGCKMKEEYVKRADDFFYYNDHNNCERIYKVMIDYQKKLQNIK
jgi:CDP-glycerol glycerophosphotransferase (TagB/SpsB family)